MIDELTARVRTTITDARLIGRGDRVLVGVSGGPDSVALLHLLVRLKGVLQMTLSVVHVDHGLRPEAADEAAFVEALAKQLGVPATIARRNVQAEVRRRRLSLEDGARRIRYEIFEAVAGQLGAARLALAHTADDQAETVLMRLIRGAGLTGLTAIPMARPLGGVTVIRPLLGVWRGELLAYLRAQGLACRQDSTNADVRFLRNRIRAQLLPLLEREYNPNIRGLLNQLAEQCREDAFFLQQAAQRHWRRLVKSHNGSLAIRVEAFLKQPVSVQRQLIRLAIHAAQGDLTGFEFRHWQEIDRLFRQRPVGTLVDLPWGLRVERAKAHVMLHRSRRQQVPTTSLASLER